MIFTALENVDKPDTFNEPRVPTEVNEELTIPDPRPFADKTPLPLILYLLPDARSKCSLDFNASDELSHVSVFLILSEPIPIPAPSRRRLVPAVVAIPIWKSPSSILSTSTINSLPSTYKSPLTLTMPLVVPTPNG